MMKNKSTLAKLLAEEDIFVIHKQMETAYFDSKKRELGLPIWKDEEMTKDIYDLMVGHEIGHALWTPLDMLEAAAIRKIDHGFVNILEDARIEKKAKGKYPGLVGVFNRGYVDLLKKDFFGTGKKNIASFNLIDRINVFFKTGDTTIPFSDEEKVWVKKTASTKTPDDVLDLAEELYAWMEENAPEEVGDDEKMIDGSGNGESGNGESGEGEEGETGEGNAPTGEKDEEGKEEGDSSASGNGEENDKSDDGDDGAAGGKSGGKSASDETPDEKSDADSSEGDSTVGGKETSGAGSVPKATTDSAFGKALDELRDKMAENRIYAKIPKVDLNEIIISPKAILDEFKPFYLEEKKSNDLYWNSTFSEVENLKSESKTTVSYMVKEFEMKKAADQYARAATSKTGSLDMSKLHTYKYNEDLFKKVTTLPGATNHGMVMVLDWSGSMAENLKGTLAQMFNLIWFCRRIKIPFEVFAFSDGYGRNDRWKNRGTVDEKIENKNFKAGDIVLHDFKLLNFFSSNLTVSDEMDMMHILWMYANRWTREYRDWAVSGYPYNVPSNLNLGGTPLNDSIIAMMDLLPKFKRETGVQKVNTIFLTDGASNWLDGVYDYGLNTETGEHYETVTQFNRGRAKVVITDPVMNKTYTMSSTYGDMTNELLKILKGRVEGMNIVGFFIAGSGKLGRIDKRTLYSLLPMEDRNKIMDMIKFANKNKYVALTQLGYDEYYVLPGGSSLSVENETLSDDLIGAKKGKLKSAFGKIAKGKIASRPLLNKFVKMVA